MTETDFWLSLSNASQFGIVVRPRLQEELDKLCINKAVEKLYLDDRVNYCILVHEVMKIGDATGSLDRSDSMELDRLIVGMCRQVAEKVDALDLKRSGTRDKLRMLIKRRRELIHHFAQSPSSTLLKLVDSAVEESVHIEEELRSSRKEDILSLAKPENPRSFQNMDGCCGLISLLVPLIQLDSFPGILDDSALSDEFRRVLEADAPVAEADGIRLALDPVYQYIPGNSLGGGFPQMFFNLLVDRLPGLKRLTETEVRVGGVSQKVCMHSIIATEFCHLSKLFAVNEYQFITLPSVLCIRLHKFQLSSPEIDAPLHIICPTRDFPVVAADGSVRRYILKSTIQLVPGHVFSHVCKDGQWFKVDNGRVSELNNESDIINKNTFILFFELVT